MQRDRAYLVDILQAARLAIAYVSGVSEDTFLRDTQLQDAVVRRIEIIGEAARRISASARREMPELPWTEMVGMRNLMIHEYDDVDFRIVWETIQRDLPAVIAALEPLIAPEED